METNILRKEIEKAARYSRDPDTRSKVRLFLRALEVGAVQRACQEAGKAPRYYYYWWNRFRDSGFQIQSLKKLSRRPKRIPRRTPDSTVRWIKFYREKFSYNPEVLSLYLEREKGIRISKSTVYRILLRERLPLLRPGRKKNPGTPAIPEKAFRRKRVRRPTEKNPPALPESQVGRILAERFQLLRPLGAGGGGTVYLAEDRRAKRRKLALKLLPWKGQSDTSLALSLKNEFQILSTLKHAHLAEVFDFGTEETDLFFTSEWVEGQNILKICEGSNLNVILQLLVQVLRGLDYLHGKGVLHLDLKPENILVTDPERSGELQVKLIDFGTAQWAKRGHGLAGDFVGTPPYSAPEIILEQTPSPASDIYSLGMILYRIFARGFPFASQDPLEIMKEQVYGEPLPVTQLPPALPLEFSLLLRQMVARDPKARPQSSAEVLQALNSHLGENFTLKGKTAPLRILEGSEFLFHQTIWEDLVSTLQRGEPGTILLSAPAQSGKSFLLKKIKQRLQLIGKQPLWFEAREPLEEYLLKAPAKSLPILVDFGEAEPSDWSVLFDRMENAGISALLTTRLTPSPELHPTQWVTLPFLSLDALSEFLKAEIENFPIDLLALPLFSLCRGIPLQLEAVLQAMQEEGLLQWTHRGWNWVGAPSENLTSLMANHQARWNERLARVQEILSFTRLTLNSSNLEGLLGLDPGSLTEKLAEWARQGRVGAKTIRRVPHYLAPEESKVPAARASPERHWVEQELVRLYERGDFSSGVELSNLLLEGGAKPKLSPKLVLLAARHFVAAGYSQRALEALPLAAVLSPEWIGMFHEIRARAFFNLGDLPQSQNALTEAESAYREISDSAGLARIQNLSGSVLKRLQRFEDAEAAFRNSARLAAEKNEPYIQALALMNLGIFFYEQGQFDRTRQSYLEAFELEKKLQQPLLSCKLRENWVNLLYHLGQSAEAERACYQLLQTSIHYRYREQQASALNYLALLAGQRDNHSLQLHYLQQAAAILDREVHRQLFFQTVSNRAYAHLALKKYVAAQLDAESAFELAEKSATPAWRALAYLTLGKILRDRPRPDLKEASKHFNNAHLLVRQNHIQQLLWEVEFDRGLLAKKKGEPARAENYFLSAKRHLLDYLASMPEVMRVPFLRDRKLEKVEEQLLPR